jgi:hypothetical protein
MFKEDTYNKGEHFMIRDLSAEIPALLTVDSFEPAQEAETMPLPFFIFGSADDEDEDIDEEDNFDDMEDDFDDDDEDDDFEDDDFDDDDEDDDDDYDEDDDYDYEEDVDYDEFDE